VNKVTIVGNISTDIKQNEAKTVASFSVAAKRKFVKDGEPDADFITCKAFNKMGEFIAKYFHKGMKIGISGRIQTGDYTGKDGVKRYTTDVIVEDAEFVESKKAAGTAADNQGAETTDGWQEIPDGIENSLPFK
jgi:single-strand DNA-binding protein